MNLWYVNSVLVKLLERLCECKARGINFDPDIQRLRIGGVFELALERQIFQVEKHTEQRPY